jgi:hypothetical protein
LQSRVRCDEEASRQSLDDLLERCQATVEYLDYAEKMRTRTRTCPEDFEQDTDALRQRVTDGSGYLSEAQRNVVEKAITDLEGALSAKQRESLTRLAQLEQGLERSESASKVQVGLERAEWSFLPTDARDSLEGLKRQIQEHIDSDESQLTERHFRNIRDTQTRRKCLEALQRLFEEVV